MNYTLKILESEFPTQYPYQMSRESFLHKSVSAIYSRPKVFDYFVILDNKTTIPKIKTEEPELKTEEPELKTEDCNLIDGDGGNGADLRPIGKTMCPSDHVPIYMDYTFEGVDIRIISWNIQYFINDSENKILKILIKLTSEKENFIILLQEIKGKNNNTNYDNSFNILQKNLLLGKIKGYKKYGFQATLYSFSDSLSFFRKHNIKRCYTFDTCQKINNELEPIEKKYSSLLLIFLRQGSASEKKLLFVNNVHLVSPGTLFRKALNKQSRFVEFNNIIQENFQLLNNLKPDTYEMIFGGDMNTPNFTELLFSNLNLNHVALGGKTKKKRNSQQKRTSRRTKNKLLIKKKKSQKCKEMVRRYSVKRHQHYLQKYKSTRRAFEKCKTFLNKTKNRAL